LYEQFTETGIWGFETQTATVVTAVPLSPEQIQARVAVERKEKIKNTNRLEAEARRRKRAAMPREQWLEAHRDKPWEREGISQRTWYRRKKGGKGASGGG
jgi:hypothetical protein